MKLHPVVIRNVVTVVVECNNGGIRFGVVNFDATVTVKYTDLFRKNNELNQIVGLISSSSRFGSCSLLSWGAAVIRQTGDG
jgi:hypothetical protein